MTRLFLDTEFNGFGGPLISMALVSDDGREWYEVVDPQEPIEPWVAEHVIPLLDKKEITEYQLRRSLHAFLRQFDNPVIVADWHADFVHFFNAFHGLDYTESLDFSCQTILLSGPSDIRPERPHNALSDARALRDWYRDNG
jgi:hypothetical protein